MRNRNPYLGRCLLTRSELRRFDGVYALCVSLISMIETPFRTALALAEASSTKRIEQLTAMSAVCVRALRIIERAESSCVHGGQLYYKQVRIEDMQAIAHDVERAAHTAWIYRLQSTDVKQLNEANLRAERRSLFASERYAQFIERKSSAILPLTSLRDRIRSERATIDKNIRKRAAKGQKVLQTS